MKRRAKGLTLIELMVTLAVAIVLLAIGIPAFNTLTARDVSAAQVNALVTALTQARVAAAGGAGMGVVCAASSRTETTSTCGSATNWTNGWLAFVEPPFVQAQDGADTANPPNQVLDAGKDQLLRRFAWPGAQISIAATNANGGIAAMSFGSTGEVQFPTTTPVTFDIRAYSDAGKTKCVRRTRVTVTATGQIRSDIVGC